MSDQSHNPAKTNIVQKSIAILGGLVAPILVVTIFTQSGTATVTEDSAAKIEERIKPIAMVEVAADSGPHVEKSGEEVVKAACAACHAVGAMGSPKIGDKSAWGPRIAQGYKTLIKHAIDGVRAMPARGGNPDLTDGEIAGAVAYMANQAGAKFTPFPTAKPATARSAKK
jgi:cytochrome c5